MRPDRPIKLKIGYKDWTVYFVDKLEDCYGYCDFEKSTIRIVKGQRRLHLVDTLFHEILHAILDAQGCTVDDENEEGKGVRRGA